MQYLPQHFTSSNGLRKESHKIVLIDGEGGSWTLDLRFNDSSDTFYMNRWRSFCEENGQEAGGNFTFKLVGNGETPVLCFCPTESITSKRQRDSSEEEEEDTEWESGEEDEPLKETEKNKCDPKRRAVPYSSDSPLILEDTTPAFSLCCPDQSTTDKDQEDYFKRIKKQSLYIDPGSKDKNNKEENMSWERDSTPSGQNPLVTIKIRPYILTCNRMVSS